MIFTRSGAMLVTYRSAVAIPTRRSCGPAATEYCGSSDSVPLTMPPARARGASSRTIAPDAVALGTEPPANHLRHRTPALAIGSRAEIGGRAFGTTSAAPNMR
jgi:hypothetical protein